MFCEKCGMQLTEDSKFCVRCGAKLNRQAAVQRKRLTPAMIKKALTSQRNSLWAYFGQLLMVALTVLIIHLGAAGAVIFIVFIAINVLRMIWSDLRRCAPKFYVLERECVEKSLREQDEGPDEWQLWFANADGTLHVAITVEKDFYDKTAVGEPFYVVFMQSDRCPSLLYRKSEWLLDIRELSERTRP